MPSGRAVPLDVYDVREVARAGGCPPAAIQALVDSGVQPSDIDAGYAWTGWVLYAHPENLAKGLTVNDVPWVTSKRQAQYRIAKERLDGYDVAREVAWEDGDVWPAPDRLYVLKRRPGAPPARRPSSGSSE